MYMCFPMELFICYKAASVKFNECLGPKFLFWICVLYCLRTHSTRGYK